MINTERLLLRATTDDDIEQLYHVVFSQTEVMQYLPQARILSYKETKEYIQKSFIINQQNIGLGSLIEKSSQSIIGFSGLLYCDYLGLNDIECGYAIAQSHWHKGYATEIGKALIENVFKQQNRCRVLATVAAKNRTSIHVLLKLGFQYTDSINIEGRGEREIYVRQK